MLVHGATRQRCICRLTITCTLLLFAAGCHKKAVVKAPVIPLPPIPPPTIPVPLPVSAPWPAAAATLSTVAVVPVKLPPPFTPAKPSPFPPLPTPPPAHTAPVPAPVVPAPVAPLPAPALGAILSADERRKLDAEYQSDLRQATQILNRLRGRRLTPDQNDTATRARAFIRQAGQYHDRDLTTAAELARRARVLTQDLAGAP